MSEVPLSWRNSLQRQHRRRSALPVAHYSQTSVCVQQMPKWQETCDLQGNLAHKKQSPLLRPPRAPLQNPTVGSWGGAVSYERGTLVPRDTFTAKRCVWGSRLWQALFHVKLNLEIHSRFVPGKRQTYQTPNIDLRQLRKI